MTATRIVAAAFAAAVCIAATTAAPASAEPAWDKVAQALGKSGAVMAGGIYRIGLPRTDLKVTLDGIELKPGFALGSWLAFEPTGDQAMVMGDLVLTESEVNPVISALLASGLEVTALHNHFQLESPRIFYMHVHGHGPASELANKLKPAIELIGKTSTPTGDAGKPLEESLDTAQLAKIVGAPGEASGPVYKITIGRPDIKLTEMGAPINARMGLNTWAAFYGSDADAVVAGDIAMLDAEVQPVLKALRNNGINVVAIHQHMIATNPAVIFLHYWGRGPAPKLAAGVRAAFDQTGHSNR
jgi:Domain of Unknown Function (DUF1259)